MKSAKEESTGYTDTSFMKPSLIYFPNPLAELSQCILDSSNGSIINVI